MAMDMDDEAVMAAGAAAVATLQNMQSVMLGVATDGDDVAQGLAFEEDTGAEEEKPKHIRRSYDRPDYWGSVWGGWLRRLEELEAGEGGLDPSCREAVQFKGAFRVPYSLFLMIMESVSSIFPDVSRDVAGRECPPVELKVCRVLVVTMFDWYLRICLCLCCSSDRIEK